MDKQVCPDISSSQGGNPFNSLCWNCWDGSLMGHMFLELLGEPCDPALAHQLIPHLPFHWQTKWEWTKAREWLFALRPSGTSSPNPKQSGPHPHYSLGMNPRLCLGNFWVNVSWHRPKLGQGTCWPFLCPHSLRAQHSPHLGLPFQAKGLCFSNLIFKLKLKWAASNEERWCTYTPSWDQSSAVRWGLKLFRERRAYIPGMQHPARETHSRINEIKPSSNSLDCAGPDWLKPSYQIEPLKWDWWGEPKTWAMTDSVANHINWI